MINILQIVISPPLVNGKNSITGPERRAARLAKRWKSEGFNVVVCYPSRGHLNNDFRTADLKVIDFEIGSKFNILSIFKLKRIVKENNIDIVHSQGPAALDLILALTSKLIKVKTIITRPVMIADQVNYSNLRIKIYEFIDKNITLKIVDSIIAVSCAGCEVLRDKYRVQKSKLQLIYNGVDTDKIVPGKYEKSKYEIRIGMIGQLFPPKGWFDFISTIQFIKNRSSKVIKALIIGEGELEEELIKMSKYYDLDDCISFEGYVDDIKVKLKELDMILFTTHREGLSVAVLEAMAAGLPQVITDVGGGREQIIHGENGFVVQVGDIEKMGTYCLELIENEDLRFAFGKTARMLAVEKFSEEEMFKKHVQLYKEIFAK